MQHISLLNRNYHPPPWTNQKERKEERGERRAESKEQRVESRERRRERGEWRREREMEIEKE